MLSAIKLINNDNSTHANAEASNVMLLHEKWEKLVADAPGATVILGDSFRWSRHELDLRANRVAHYLCTDLKLNHNDTVALFCIQSQDYVASLLGVLKAGCVPVPVDRGFRWDKANQFISEGNCKFILADEQGLEICQNMGIARKCQY